jgi:hypothetical protein
VHPARAGGWHGADAGKSRGNETQHTPVAAAGSPLLKRELYLWRTMPAPVME